MVTTLAPISPPQAAAPALTFDERLALSPLAMNDRLDLAGLAFDVNTAAIPVEAPEILTAPAPAATPKPVTVDDVLREARRLITAHGWIRQYVGRAETGYCLIGAIRAAAGGNSRLEDEAETGMLDRIRRQFPDALSVGAWNDAQCGPAPVLRMLG
ncbi:DUF6197 family protein [Streptomyces sp. 4.24]|uniref:DUF6197 family protein n=1 Tax=Streptomyces tritrimontium TaxID=3406573 RepID=UPI003BB619E1